MRLRKLKSKGWQGDELRYLEEVWRRLTAIFRRYLTHAEAIALMQVITLYHFRFADGFVLNDALVDERMLGFSNAAVIAATFCKDPDQDWTWWKAEYPAYDKASDTYQETYYRILATIVSYPAVRETSR
jgi:hypothetical protein